MLKAFMIHVPVSTCTCKLRSLNIIFINRVTYECSKYFQGFIYSSMKYNGWIDFLYRFLIQNILAVSLTKSEIVTYM